MAEENADDWEEEPVLLSSGVPSPCLFCDQSHIPAEEILQHCVRDHSIDLRLLRRQLSEVASEGDNASFSTCIYTHRAGLDFYSWAKLINYLRSEVGGGVTCSLL